MAATIRIIFPARAGVDMPGGQQAVVGQLQETLRQFSHQYELCHTKVTQTSWLDLEVGDKILKNGIICLKVCYQ